MNALDLDARVAEKLGEPVGAVLGAREDERVVHVLALQQVQQQRRLQMLRHRIDRVRDPDRGRRAPLDVDRRRRLQHLLRQLRDRRRHRRAEEQRLALRGRRQVLQHAADVGQEAHVEHAVGFVEHEVLQAAELRVGRAEVIEQAAGRRDDDVDAAAEGVLLRPHADAAEDGGRGQRRVHREVVEVFDDLRRELARRRQHERARRAARLADQAVEDRQQKRRGLAAAGHGAGEQVLAGHRERNRVSLNRRRSRKTEIFEPLEQAGMESEFGKWHGSL